MPPIFPKIDIENKDCPTHPVGQPSRLSKQFTIMDRRDAYPTVLEGSMSILGIFELAKYMNNY
ncbi:MAG: hypothetical protein IMF10_05960 [Proteobacteria bacterium]|nr:hypothetical protein [Pseudomonadota bacterium]